MSFSPTAPSLPFRLQHLVLKYTDKIRKPSKKHDICYLGVQRILLGQPHIGLTYQSPELHWPTQRNNIPDFSRRIQRKQLNRLQIYSHDKQMVKQNKGISYSTNATWQCSSDPKCTLLKHVNMMSSSVKVVVWTHIANLDHSVKVRIVAPISQLLQHRISKKGQETFYPLQNQNYGKLNSSGMRQTKQAQQLS